MVKPDASSAVQLSMPIGATDNSGFALSGLPISIDKLRTITAPCLTLRARFRPSGGHKVSAERDSWSAAGHLRRLGDPIVDTSSMIAFALDDGRQIALQKDTDPNRLWVEHDEIGRAHV